MSAAGLSTELPGHDELSAIVRPEGGARVVAVRAAAIGAGQLSECLRLGLTWEPAGAGPPTVVAKLASSSPRRRRVAQTARSYELEVGFYRDLAPALTVNVPPCYHAMYRASPPQYCLVLADMASLAAGDDLSGCSADEAARAVEQLARLHA